MIALVAERLVSGRLGVRFGSARRSWALRSTRRAVRKMAPLIVGSVQPRPGSRPTGNWVVRKVRSTETNVTVLYLGPPGRSPVALAKVATGRATAERVMRNLEHLNALHGDDRLRGRLGAVPHPLAHGADHNRFFTVEQAMAGQAASRWALRDGEPVFDLLARSVRALTECRRGSYGSRPVDELVDRWVTTPLDSFRRILPSRLDDATDRRVGHLRSALAEIFDDDPQSVGWTHGDYWFGNVLFTESGGPVTGIVDWDSADPEGLPILDIVGLLLTTRALLARCDLGDVVCAFLAGSGWSRPERQLLEMSEQFSSVKNEAIRALVLLAWLSHVTDVIAKRPEYATSGPWMRHNVLNPLTAIGDSMCAR